MSEGEIEEAVNAHKKPKCWSFSNISLIVFFISSALISVCMYLYWLGQSQPSRDPSDWADFATYLSGTVGVAAVVATLFAFIKTLGQQQALITSQDEMLKKQQQQLQQTEKQLSYAEKKDELNRAYQAGVSIFPTLIESIKIKSELDFPWCVPIAGGDNRLYMTFFQARNYMECIHSAETFMHGVKYHENHMKGKAMERSCVEIRDGVVEFIEEFFYEPYLVFGFIFEQLSVDGRLYYLFVSYMKQRLSKEVDIISLMKCAYAFKKGIGDDLFCKRAEDLLFMNSEYLKHESEWLNLGKAIGEMGSSFQLSQNA